MKRFWFGLITGLMIGGGVYFLVTPKVSEKAYSAGHEKGLAEGEEKGIADGRVLQKKEADSIAVAVKKNTPPPPRPVKAKPKPYVNPNDKNYHVYGNRVAEERAAENVQQ